VASLSTHSRRTQAHRLEGPPASLVLDARRSPGRVDLENPVQSVRVPLEGAGPAFAGMAA